MIVFIDYFAKHATLKKRGEELNEIKWSEGQETCLVCLVFKPETYHVFVFKEN